VRACSCSITSRQTSETVCLIASSRVTVSWQMLHAPTSVVDLFMQDDSRQLLHAQICWHDCMFDIIGTPVINDCYMHKTAFAICIKGYYLLLVYGTERSQTKIRWTFL